MKIGSDIFSLYVSANNFVYVNNYSGITESVIAFFRIHKNNWAHKTAIGYCYTLLKVHL